MVTLLDTEVRSQLTTLRDLRRDSIESGVDRLLDRVAVIASDPGVAQALTDDRDMLVAVNELSSSLF